MSLDRQNLDALLKQANWPDVSPDSRRRLEEFWKDRWSARPLRANWLWPMATAAAIIIGLGSVIVLVLTPPRIPGPMPNPGRSISILPPPGIKLQPVTMESRPPTMRELMLVGDMRPKKRMPATAPTLVQQQQPSRDPQLLASLAWQETQPQRQRETIAELLRSEDPFAIGLYLQLVVDVRRRAVALDALADVKQAPVQALIEQLSNSRVAIRFAAARALGKIDGPMTTEQLVALVKQNTQRREALAALLCSDGTDASAFLASARHMPGLSTTVRAVEIQLQSVQ